MYITGLHSACASTAEREYGGAPRGHVGPRGDRADAAARRLAHRRAKQGTPQVTRPLPKTSTSTSTSTAVHYTTSTCCTLPLLRALVRSDQNSCIAHK